MLITVFIDNNDKLMVKRNVACDEIIAIVQLIILIFNLQDSNKLHIIHSFIVRFIVLKPQKWNLYVFANL